MPLISPDPATPASLPPLWNERPGFAALIDALGGASSARLVGGAVRDGLLGTLPSDIDLATVHPPMAVIERLSAAGIRTVPTGLLHGTVTAVLPGGPVEVTTVRRDVESYGRHARVAFTDDWRTDAERRDFTFNALFAAPDSGQITDYFGGAADLASGRVRFIGVPLERIAEDHLRILRFFRFFARYGTAPIDAEGYAACVARARDLMALSRERIGGELLKLCAAPTPLEAVRLMVAGGIFRAILPEIDESGVDRLAELLARESMAGASPAPLRRLAALIGPHPEIARAIATRLRLSKVQMRHLDQITAPDAAASPLIMAYRLGEPAARDRILLGEGPVTMLEMLADYQRPVLPIGGGDLIAHGVPRGPRVAQSLAAIELRWLEAGCPQGEEFEVLVRQMLTEKRRNAGSSAH